MQYVMKALAGGLVWAAIVTCYCARANDISETEHNMPLKTHDDSNLQMDGDMTMVKRAWNNMPQSMGWGKRAWRNLQSAGWGKRLADSYAADKRAWQKFQAGWGKRWSPEDEYNQADNNDNEPQQYDEYIPPSVPDMDDMFDQDKRTWRSLNTPWGKRATNDWASFRGAWGKRDPAWNNLKGLWGKRSIQDRISS